jgi:hypothetical protein
MEKNFEKTKVLPSSSHPFTREMLRRQSRKWKGSLWRMWSLWRDHWSTIGVVVREIDYLYLLQAEPLTESGNALPAWGPDLSEMACQFGMVYCHVQAFWREPQLSSESQLFPRFLAQPLPTPLFMLSKLHMPLSSFILSTLIWYALSTFHIQANESNLKGFNLVGPVNS